MSSVFLPDSIINIGEWAFDYCYNIRSITIPKNVIKIGSSAFFECSGMQEIFFMGSAPEFGEDAFSEVDAIVYYPQNDDSWTDSVKQQYGGMIEWFPWNPD